MKRNRGQRGHLVVAHSRDRYPRARPGRAGQARAIKARATGPRSAEDIRAAELVVGKGDGLLGLRRGWAAIVAPAAAAATAAGTSSGPLRWRQGSQQILLLLLELIQHGDPLVQRALQRHDRRASASGCLPCVQQLPAS